MVQIPSVRKKISKPQQVFILLLSGWFLINLLQAVFMEILSDEAYYGLYGKFLDWGYYDHPPMVALLVRISSLVFSGNLGIRFMTIILQLGTILLIWKTLGLKNPDVSAVISFFIISGSISMFSAYGVITAPDAPLLFFTALFLFLYKKFIDNQKWSTTLLLALSMAGLIYSKYQSVLVIGFIILADIRLLRSIKFWIAGLLALLLLSPHFYWQYTNNFPSFQYHLIDRADSFDWKYFLEYLPNQMAVFNPLILGAAFYVILKYKAENKFNRSLYLQIIGFIGFFWLTSFRGHVEPHWTIACSIPMIILISEKSIGNAALFRFTRKYLLPSVFLLIMIRIFLLIDSGLNKTLAFSGKKEKYKFIESVAGDLPVIFTGSFQKPSLYPFFTGKEATVISSVYSRLTQFDLWQFEVRHHNKPAFVCAEAEGRSMAYGSGRLGFSGFRTDSLQTVNRMKISFNLEDVSINPGDTVRISFNLSNPYNYDIDFNHRQFPVWICIVLLKGDKKYSLGVALSEPINIISSGETVGRSLVLVMPEIPGGKYNLGISLSTLLGPSFNSHFTKVEIGSND